MPILSENRRVRYDYDIIEKYESGIQLRGFEAKSARIGRMNLAGAYVIIRPSASSKRAAIEAWLLNADIPPYQAENTPRGYEQSRTRKLLLRRTEILELSEKLSQKGLTLLPLKVYNKNHRIKIELGLARSRKAYDKRAHIKKREAQTEIKKVLRQN